jgi:hypothetical protein
MSDNNVAIFSHPRMAVLEADLRSKMEPLRLQKQKCITDKVAIQAKLSELKGRIRGRTSHFLPPDEYQKIVRAQTQANQALWQIEAELQAISTESQRINNLNHAERNKIFHEVRESINGNRDLIPLLAELAEKYSKFSGDTTRIASMRASAATFAQEIRDIIKAGYSGSEP